MPFQKGNKINIGSNRGGRKGYEYEKKQLKKMRKLLNGLFNLGDKIQMGKATPKQIERFNILLKLNLKIMDKLHANRQSHEITGEITSKIYKWDTYENRKDNALPTKVMEPKITRKPKEVEGSSGSS